MVRSEERYGRKVVLNLPRRNVAARAVPGRGPIRDRSGGEVESGADAVLDERAGQMADGRVRGLPAGAVSRDDHLGREPFGARTVSGMTLTRAMDSWMPGR